MLSSPAGGRPWLYQEATRSATNNLFSGVYETKERSESTVLRKRKEAVKEAPKEAVINAIVSPESGLESSGALLVLL